MQLSGDGRRLARPWRYALVLFASLAFLWPAVLNGGVHLFPDSVQYIRGPDAALGKLLGPKAKSDWSIPRPAATGAARIATASDEQLANTPRTGRSIYYGALANLGARAGQFWLTMALQAMAAGLSIDLLCRAMGWTRIRTLLLVMAAAAFTTTIPIYADFVMPDLFAAVLLIACAALAAGGERLSRTDLGLAWALIVYSAVTHTSHMAMLAVVIPVAAVLWLVGRGSSVARAQGRLAVLCLTALAVAGTAGFGFNLLIKKAYHAPPIAVPFLTARIVSFDHPGAQWLRQHCPQAGFAVCKVRDRLPMSTNDFLWSIAPVEKTAFNTAPPHEQAQMGAEQWRFFLSVARDMPLQTARAFLTDWRHQIANFSLVNMNVDKDQRAYLDQLVPDSYEQVFHRSLAYRQRWPVDWLTRGLTMVTLLSVLALFGVSVRSPADQPGSAEARLMAAALVVAVAVLVNAAVCGGLSGVFGRYQARALPPVILLGWFAVALLLRSRGPARATGSPLEAASA